jgi:hypothetical protein
MRCLWPVLLALTLGILLVQGCDDTSVAPNTPPLALAEGDTLVWRGAALSLRGSASDADGAILRYEWQIEGDIAFVPVTDGDTSFAAPAFCDPDFVCILRVVDNDGAVAYDTLHVQVIGNCAPTALASGDAAAAPESLITLHADGHDPEGPLSYEWSIGGGGFTAASGADTTVLAPARFDMDYPCILRVTDDSGATALDTHHVIVSWIRSPNGGESFSVGDSLHVQLFAVNELVGLKLMVLRLGEDMDLGIGGSTGSFSPMNDPTISFIIPDTIYDDFYGPVSTVSDSCRIRIFRYQDSQTYVQSAGFFTILPRP